MHSGQLIESGALAQLDGRQRKLQNLRRNPHVVVSFEGTGDNGVGMRDYLVVHGMARLTEGGGPWT